MKTKGIKDVSFLHILNFMKIGLTIPFDEERKLSSDTRTFERIVADLSRDLVRFANSNEPTESF